MATIHHLSNPPITEALIDLRVPLVDLSPDSVQAIQSELADRYPGVEQKEAFEARLEVKEGRPRGAETRELGVFGVFLKSRDERNIAQFRQDGFTYNRLSPYSSWEEASEEAKALWRLYLRVLQPRAVERAALRYINHLRFPREGFSFDKFLTILPMMPDDMPPSVSSHLITMQIHDAEHNAFVRVTQSVEGPFDQEVFTILLDIEAWKSGLMQPNPEQLFQHLQSLRELKNRAFFGALKEEAVRTYE